MMLDYPINAVQQNIQLKLRNLNKMAQENSDSHFWDSMEEKELFN